MAKFAKLFDTPHGQLLATVEGIDDQFDGPTVCIRGEAHRSAEPSYRVGPFPDDDHGWDLAEQFLDAIDQKAAENHAFGLFTTLDNFMTSIEAEQPVVTDEAAPVA